MSLNPKALVAGASAAALLGVLAATSLVSAQPAARNCTSETGGASNVLAEAQAFAATLNASQKQALVMEYTKANAAKWSNLPFNMVPRNGVKFGDLSADQTKAAQRLVTAAMSSCGSALLSDIRAAETGLNRVKAAQWDPAHYYIAFVGQPSTLSPWILQVGGHHIAYNIAYNGPEVSATPLFDGVEPIRFKEGNRDYEPLAVQHAAMRGLAQGISGKTGSALEGTFRDVSRGPGRGGDTEFPLTYPTGAAGRGVAYNSLSSDEKALVYTAIRAWTDLPNSAISSVLMREYLSDAALAQTYVGFSGSAAMDRPGSYVRIDGPRLWIEFVVQPGATNPQDIHFHTIWRDKQADYGGAFRS